jgi:hypothetical protein
MANYQLFRARNGTLVRQLLTSDKSKNCALSGTIRTNEASPLPGLDLKTRIPKQNVVAVLASDVYELGHDFLKK